MRSHRQFQLATGLTFLLAGWVIPPAFAHRVGVDCKVTGKRVEVEAFYDDGTPAREARVTIRDTANKIVTEGHTDAKGRWTMTVSLPGRYQVELHAGEGHDANASITVPATTPEDFRLLVRCVKNVGAEGAGNPQARGALAALILSGPEAIIPLLTALDDADGAAMNWLREAIDIIAERFRAARRPLPAAGLEKFVRERQHVPRARCLAFEWLLRADAQAARRLLPHMLDDPSLELRRAAVAWYTTQADERLAKGQSAEARAAYRKALSAARDRDQVRQLAGALDKLGVKVDLAAHFGFIRQWQLVGPFDNTGTKGWRTTFASEKRIDLTATYEGKGGHVLRWQPYQTTRADGVVDLNQALGQDQEVVAYALAVVVAAEDRDVQVRAGSNNAVQIFLNGRRIYAREFGHQGMRMDQHVGKGKLRAGRNEILIKVCQDANVRASHQWSFQLRVCDALGGAVPVTVVGTDPTGKGVKP